MAKNAGSPFIIANPTKDVNPADHPNAFYKVFLCYSLAKSSGDLTTSSTFFYYESNIGNGFGSGHNFSPL